MSYENFDPNDLLIQSYSTKPESNFGTHRIPNGIRAIHLPTGTVVTCTEDRSQHRNRHLALTQLWDQVQGKPSYAELAAQVEVLRDAICKYPVTMIPEVYEALFPKTPTACLAQVRAEAVIAALTGCEKYLTISELGSTEQIVLVKELEKQAERIRQEVV